MFSSPSAVNCSASKSARSRRGILKESVENNNTAIEDECEQSMSASTMKIEVNALTPRASSPRRQSLSNMYLGSNSAPANRGVSSLLSVDTSPPRGQRRSIFKGPVSNSSVRTSSNPLVSPRKLESPPLSYAPEPPPLVDTPQQRLLHNLCRLPGCETKLKTEMLSDEVVETDGTYFNPGYESWMAKKASAALAEVTTYSTATSRRESQTTITTPVQNTGSFASSKGPLTRSYYSSTSRPALQSTPFLPSIPTGSRMLKKSVTSFEQLRASPRQANLSPQQQPQQQQSSSHQLFEFDGTTSISDPFGGGGGHSDAFGEVPPPPNNTNNNRKPFNSVTEDTAVEGGASSVRRSGIKRSNRQSEITSSSSNNASTRRSEPFSPFSNKKLDNSFDTAGKNRVAHFSEQLITEAKHHPGGVGGGGGPALFGGATLHTTQPDKYSSSTQAMSSLLKRSKSSVVSYHQSPAGSRRTSSSSMHDNYIMAAAAARRKAAEQHTKDLISQFRRLRTKMATFIQLISAVHNNTQETMRSIMGVGNRSAHPRISYNAVSKSVDDSIPSLSIPGGGELNVNGSCDVSGSTIDTPFLGATPSTTPRSSTTFPPLARVGGGDDSPRAVGFDLAPTSSSQYRAATKQRVLTMLRAYWDMMNTYAVIGSDVPDVPSSPIITQQPAGDQQFSPKPLHLPTTLFGTNPTTTASPPRGPMSVKASPSSSPASVTPTPPTAKRQEDPAMLPPAHPFQEGGNLHRFLRRDPHMLVLADWHCAGPSASFTHSSGPKARSAAILQADITDEFHDDHQTTGSASPSPSRPLHHHHQSPSSSHTGKSPFAATSESNALSVDLLTKTSPRTPTDFQIAESRLLDEALYHKKAPQFDATLEDTGLQHLLDEDDRNNNIQHNRSTPRGGEYIISLRFPELGPSGGGGNISGEAPSLSLPKLNDEVESAAFAFDLSCALRKAWRVQRVRTENLLLDSGLPPEYDDELDKSGMSDDGGDSPETPTAKKKKKSSQQQAPIQGVASTEEWIDDSLEFLRMIDDHIAALEKHQLSQTQPSSSGVGGSGAIQGLRQNSFCEKPVPNIEDTGDFHLFPCSVLMYLLCYEGLAKVPPPPLEGVLIYKGYTRPLTIGEETLREQYMWKQIEAIALGKGGPLQPLKMQESYPTLRGAGTAAGMSDLTQHWVVLSGLTASLPGGASKKKLRQLSVICKRNGSRTAGSVSVFGGASGVTVPKMSPGLKDLSLPFCNLGIEGLLVLMEFLATGGRGLGPNGEVESSSDDEYAGSEDLVVTRSFVPTGEMELSKRSASHGRRGVSRTTVTGPPASQQQKNPESWGHFMLSSPKITARITLSSLDLSYNRIDCHCLIVLKAFLPHTFITSLSLRHNDLGDVGFEEHIAFLLGDDAALESLDLSYTSLSTSSKASVIRTMPRSQLISLKLEGLQFSASEAIALFHSASNNKSLLELSLVFNGSCGSKGYVQRVQDVLRRNLKSLEDRFVRAAAELVHHLTKKNEMSASVIGNGGITTAFSATSSPGSGNSSAASKGAPPQRVSSFITRGEGALSAGYREYTTNDPTQPCWLSPPN